MNNLAGNQLSQPGYSVYENLKSLIVTVKHSISNLRILNDLNSSTLSVQLQNLGSWFKEKSERLDCIQAM